MKLLAKGVTVCLKLEDKNTGALYANCPVETYPGITFCCTTPNYILYPILKCHALDSHACLWDSVSIIFGTNSSMHVQIYIVDDLQQQ